MKNKDRANASKRSSEPKDTMLVKPHILGLFSNSDCILFNSLAYIFSLQQKIIFIQAITFKIRPKHSISSPLRSNSSRIIHLIFTVSDEANYDGPCGP